MMVESVGLTPEQFDDLLGEVAFDIVQPRDPDATRPRRCDASPANRLLLVLYWLRYYPPASNITMTFGVHHSTVTYELRHILPILLVRLR